MHFEMLSISFGKNLDVRRSGAVVGIAHLFAFIFIRQQGGRSEPRGLRARSWLLPRGDLKAK
jgi:hypothetical protein